MQRPHETRSWGRLLLGPACHSRPKSKLWLPILDVIRRMDERDVASRVGFEPTTKGLKVPCSATELPARGRKRSRAARQVAVATIAAS
jgi:hypothetical protein